MISVIMGKTVSKFKNSNVGLIELEHQVKLAKTDAYIRNRLIKQYQPFILKVTSKVCKQYVDKSRDEFSVALGGYNEAIDHYSASEGNGFLSFAEMVMRRRVIDYIRKETRQTRDIYLEGESSTEEEQSESTAQIHLSLQKYGQIQESQKRRNDIFEYKDQLAKFNITFQDLVKQCPKHQDARENAKQIAKKLASDPRDVDYLLQKKQLPMKDLLKKVQCSRKTIERNRKYIIALVIIHVGDYTSLRSYIEPEEEMEGGNKP